MKEYIKICLIYINRFIFSFFKVFPIKNNRIFFIAFMGKSFSCNPKAIYEKLISEQSNSFDCVWTLKDTSKFPYKNNTKVVKYLSFSFFYYLLTSKFVITNYSISPKFPIRKKQILINTWHGGGAYKKVGLNDIVKEKKRVNLGFNILSKETSYFISSCKIFTDVMSETMRLDKNQFLNIGMPRNDVFFRDYSDISKKVRNQYNISTSYGIVLFAPTYRGLPNSASENITLNIKDLLLALQEKYNKPFVCFYRGHYYVKASISEDCINTSDYPDMQDLLCAADVLITDYSSSIWDFALTKKPCFLFTPDLDEYASSVKFYTDIKDWGFPICQTNEKLLSTIKKFNYENYKENLIKAKDFYGSYEQGSSSSQVATLLKSLQ